MAAAAGEASAAAAAASAPGSEERLRAAEVEARARAISKAVRCVECGHQSIEDSQADVAILLRKLIRDELRRGSSEKEIFGRLARDYGEGVLYQPQFDAQSAVLWLLPVACFGAAGGILLYRQARFRSRPEALAKSLLGGLPLTPAEREALMKLAVPPPTKKPSW